MNRKEILVDLFFIACIMWRRSHWRCFL